MVEESEGRAKNR
jgi:hypothetical protein